MYCSKTPQLFQAQPQEGAARQRGWKTINGWDYESKKLATCLLQNAKHTSYTWHVTVNIKTVLTVDEHKLLWKKATKLFRKHFSAFYVREPNHDNHINYHLIVNSDVSEQRLRNCLKEALALVPYTHTIAPIYPVFGLCRYVCKTKEHAHKRVYFAEHIKLNKHGIIGKFWNKPIKLIWSGVIEQERTISAIIQDAEPHITRAAKYLSDLVQGTYSTKRIRRNLAIALTSYSDFLPEIQALSQQWLVSYLTT